MSECFYVFYISKVWLAMCLFQLCSYTLCLLFTTNVCQILLYLKSDVTGKGRRRFKVFYSPRLISAEKIITHQKKIIEEGIVERLKHIFIFLLNVKHVTARENARGSIPECLGNGNIGL